MTGQGLSSFRVFVKRNLVAITMIPSLILMHLGWSALQNVDSLVQEHERKPNIPIVDLLHKLTSSDSAKKMDSNIRQFRHHAD